MIDAWSRSVELLQGSKAAPVVRWPSELVHLVIDPGERDTVPRRHSLPTPAERLVLQALAAAPLTPADLAVALGIKPSTVIVRLRRMRTLGLVQRVGPLAWGLT